MKITLGPDLIECLSWSLYANPIVLFREAIQNSIDSFSSISSDFSNLNIRITLNNKERVIAITDNGPGLGKDAFFKNLSSLGESTKKGKAQAGCRGIGRISGLGICDSIIFESKHKSSNLISSCTVNAKGIRNELSKPNNNSQKDIAEFLDPFFEFSKKDDSSNQSFFTVTYQNVRHTPADFLLNPSLISKYISSVIPVTLADSFPFREDIGNFYKQHNLPNDIQVSINGSQNVVRGVCPKSSKVQMSPNLVFECGQVKSPSSEEILGSFWFIHHDYLGALEESPFRGLRFRHKNLLVGNEDTFSHLYKEPRFNRWTIAEIHPLSDRIRPSVKRDDFESSDEFSFFCSQLRPNLYKVSQLARKSSITRQSIKDSKRHAFLLPEKKKLQGILKRKLPSTVSRKRLIVIADRLLSHLQGRISAKDLSGFFTNK